ncbi:hypothetical protein DJ568_03550 [Mucilaginibacter hurinus]|uniref:YdhG-like domain-containing protein n=1 Tax=Mucilaginibacter hurinus TaxID=2201324 RepID=A0A367GT02_9SPHI|nr:DUF1801 domain-containing protein [Mucilaginibacter hurinus]RCH55843.1 hypothetical protein DJ568_03550 [Mucilaginibacter hurinus]
MPAKNIDEYISGFPADIQRRLQEVRTAIKQAVPEAEEAIKYAIPTFVLNGNIVSFAAYKNHIGVYPVPKGDEKFERAIASFKAEKSTAQFRHNMPIPLQMISELTRLRVKEMSEEAAVKKIK